MSDGVPQSQQELYETIGEMRTDIKWLVDGQSRHKQHHARIEYALYVAFAIAVAGLVVGFF